MILGWAGVLPTAIAGGKPFRISHYELKRPGEPSIAHSDFRAPSLYYGGVATETHPCLGRIAGYRPPVPSGVTRTASAGSGASDMKTPITPAAIRIALVEDDPEVREKLSATLNARAGCLVVAQCADAEEALREIPAARPDLILLDVLLFRGTGIELIVPLKRALPKVPIIMLTVVERTVDIVRAIDAGASGYLLKTDASDLLADVEDVLAGRAPIVSPSVARRLLDVARRREGMVAGGASGLSPREQQVLALASQGMRQAEIAAQLGISVNTLKTHLRRAYEKLGTRSVLESVHKLRGDHRPFD